MVEIFSFMRLQTKKKGFFALVKKIQQTLKLSAEKKPDFTVNFHVMILRNTYFLGTFFLTPVRIVWFVTSSLYRVRGQP